MAKRSTESLPMEREPALRAVLGRFCDARSVLECAVRSLEQWRELNGGDSNRHTDDVEVVCLRHGLKMLDGVYDELDAAIAALSRAAREPDP